MTAHGPRTPEPFLVTDNKETGGAFSPDGRFVAYVSDESGTNNVYVRSFPISGGRKWQVSTAGGYQPRWRGDGKELFASVNNWSWDVTPDGQRFLINTVGGGAQESALTVVLNWQSGLPR